MRGVFFKKTEAFRLHMELRAKDTRPLEDDDDDDAYDKRLFFLLLPLVESQSFDRGGV